MPDELLWLENDKIIASHADKIITKWKSLKPRPDFSHGISCYFLHKNYKISKFFSHDNNLLYYYCDIVRHIATPDSYIFCDLLVDILVYPDDTVRILDLDELTFAYENNLITRDELLVALSTLDELLKVIYSGEFAAIASVLDTTWDSAHE